MNKIRVCFKIWGLGVDENGGKAFAGACLTLGETEKNVDYAKLTEDINKTELLSLCLLDRLFSPDDVVIITPEEYDRDYGEEAEAALAKEG